MKQLLLFLLISSVIIGINTGKDRQLITKDKWISDLITLARDRKSVYDNKYPYNCLYYDGTAWHTDCVHLHWALFNGKNINYLGQEFISNYCYNGDITNEGMIEKCTSVSSNFNALKEGEPRILYLNGHIGAYLGKNVIVNGAVYNVVEATGAFGRKIAFSWVDNDGTRRDKRGGNIYNRWTRHGLPTRWVIY